MQLTPKLNLKKPDLTDSINVQDLNDNMDVLDTAVSELQEGSASIPDLETNDKTLAGAINEIKQTINDVETSAKEYTDQQTAAIDTKLDSHIKDDIGHVWYCGSSVGQDVLVLTANMLPIMDKNAEKPVPKVGVAFRFIKGSQNNAGSVTLSVIVNGKSSIAYPVMKPDATQLMAGDLVGGVIYTVAFTGTFFALQGESGVKVTRNNASYNTAGTYELTVPKGVSKITAYIFGAGGGGGCYRAAINRGGGGGGGGAYLLASINVTPGQKLTIVVGKGGGGSGDVSQHGLSGGYSYVRSNGVDFIAGGGGGGGSGGSGNSDGAGLAGLGGEGGVYNKTYVPPGGSYDNKDGTLYSFAANGLTNLSERLVSFGGGDGAYFTNSSDGGGGGGAASDLSGGKKGSFSYGGAYGPYATNIYGGPGGAGAIYSASAKPGNAPGGGGGGGGYVNNGYVGGANGADGRVMLYW